MDWTDAEQLGKLFNTIAPNLTAGLLALFGVIALFALQQRAQRKANLNHRQDQAVAVLFETLTAARDTYLGDAKASRESASRMFDLSWKFRWALAENDDVGKWAMTVLATEISSITLESTKEERRSTIDHTMIDISTKLSEWRGGNRKASWFAKENAKAERQHTKCSSGRAVRFRWPVQLIEKTAV